MSSEDLEQELEALKCIYMDDFQVIYKEPLIVFEITLKDPEEQTLVRFSIKLPSDYPQAIPDIKVVRL